MLYAATRAPYSSHNRLHNSAGRTNVNNCARQSARTPTQTSTARAPCWPCFLGRAQPTQDKLSARPPIRRPHSQARAAQIVRDRSVVWAEDVVVEIWTILKTHRW